ncbi:MAG: hypothetical protein JWN32_2890, partial [Solirubrobacterales bacterium]|nr:hypothetical protein [Solirubrobacterales bacterium]
QARSAGTAAPYAVGVVAPARLATATGAALALGLARMHDSRCALLCHWGPVPGGAPAGRAAARAAAALRTREIDASAVGRLVRVALDDDTLLAASTIGRAAAVVAGPTVLAVGRPRDEGMDRALAEQDAIAWLPPDGASEALIALVVESLGALGRPVVRFSAAHPVARRLALAGIAVGAAPALEGMERIA